MGAQITFGGSPRYNDKGHEATVALLDNGPVIELYTYGDTYEPNPGEGTRAGTGATGTDEKYPNR